MSTSNDILLACEGDEGAKNRFAAKLHEWMFPYAILLCNRYRVLKDLIEPQDLIQESWIKFDRVLPRLTNHSPRALRVYCSLTIKSLAIDTIRKEMSKPHPRPNRRQTVMTGITLVENHFAKTTGILTKIIKIDKINQLLDFIATLAPDEQELLRLRYWEDKKSTEIAGKLNIKNYTARKRLSRLLTKLKNSLKK